MRIRTCLVALSMGCVVSAVERPKTDDTVDDTVDASTLDSDTPTPTPVPRDTSPPVDTSPPAVDTDGDGLLDEDDNCPEVVNPDQANLDNDSLGDACDDDVDGDSIPDSDDPYPLDVEWPGIASPETIYAHTRNTLYRFVVPNQQVLTVAGFSFDRRSGDVTDVAIDQWGVLYAVTFDDLFICRPDTAECRFQASLPGSSNGLSFVQPGVLGPSGVLMGMSGTDWYRLDRNGSSVTSSTLGTFTGGRVSSGDAFSILGEGTYGAFNALSGTGDEIVEINPATGAVLRTVVQLSGYGSVWGLAGWVDGFIYAFDESGTILQIDATTGSFTVAHSGTEAWWGAGVRTVIPLP